MIFKHRHIGISQENEKKMLADLNCKSIDNLTKNTLAKNIDYTIDAFKEISEQAFENHINEIGNKNKQTLSLIGQGFYPNYCPSIIRRNILENPCWYTQYTPYQAEISQGRLEALFNFQTIVSELTGLPVANASLLDEGNACSEAIFMAYQTNKSNAKKVFISKNLYKHNINVIKTRFKYLDITLEIGDIENANLNSDYFAIIAQQFSNDGKANNFQTIFENAKKLNVTTILCTDLLALTLFKTPAGMHSDIAVGTAQRLGIPMGFGGPAAAFIACKESFTRYLPGRIIGQSVDKYNEKSFRMALQTREQHIRREKATSNICTAQALLAIMNSFYVIYYGPDELKKIAEKINRYANILKQQLQENGFKIKHNVFFDTITIITPKASEYTKKALSKNIEWFCLENEITIAMNDCISDEDINQILSLFEAKPSSNLSSIPLNITEDFLRKSKFLKQKVFNTYHSETKLLRYIKKLEKKDLSLANSMIPLGSCTMKLNATTELLSLSNPNFVNIHPQSNQTFTKGYHEILTSLENYLSNFTGFHKTSLQPNSGAQGEFSGLLCIRDYFKHIGQEKRDIAFIPSSAHGTNPASASLCGLKIVSIKTTQNGEICLDDLNEKCRNYADRLAVLMITYPSTFGVFDETIKEICKLIHAVGGQVYMDGANMNAQVGLTSPATIGADVCHLNLHKTFCIPHGGGGPGVGPICVKEHLSDFLPESINNGKNAIANAPYGSASICIISYAYIKLMGSSGLKKATQIAILNANYIAHKLKDHFEILYTNKTNYVAHELIINCKEFKKTAKITVEDIAKRLMDFGFHAPTMSWPIPDTLMIEPTESEDKEEIDRFCDALIMIRKEIKEIENETHLVEESPLRNAPHTQKDLIMPWNKNYSQQIAFFPLGSTNDKFWPSVNRINNAYGDRNLVCTCQPVETEINIKKYETNPR